MPKEVGDTWRGILQKATDDAGFRSKMEARGSVIEMMDPDTAKAFINDQYSTFRALVDQLGMRIEG
jgi:tripartite-type tricarboxylate transporter receptor subunit TctC